MILLDGKNISQHKFKELPQFCLKNIDNELISNEQACENHDGILVMFICNHCPYVKAIAKNIAQDAHDLLKNLNIASIAINANDPDYNSEDSFENMIEFHRQNNFSFPYLFDETQEVAKTFDAVCTPDFFLFMKNDENQKFILSHKGRLNDFIYTKSGTQTSENQQIQRELYHIAEYLVGKNKPSMGCSIKWKEETKI